MTAILTTSLPLPLQSRGKVRDTYRFGEGELLMVATDRLSAFDVVLPTPIPEKGRVLTQLSRHWFEQTRDIVRNHLAADQFIPEVLRRQHADLPERSMRVLAAEPIFTPATKAATGHDENISRAELADRAGQQLAKKLEALSLALYRLGHEQALEAGIILADTKFEFGWLEGQVILIDEVMTPDSSRFWDVEQYRPGGSQPSFDKQYVRDYLEAIGWNKQPPAPALPEDVVAGTSARYLEALRRLTAKPSLAGVHAQG